MGITKTQGFSFKINDLADILKAMGNPARLKILQFLMLSWKNMSSKKSKP
jgi:DNA-binding transcriptional ArsR family regulator